MNICVFGDSIAFGYYDLEKGGWVNRLRIYLDNKKDFDGEIYNFGTSGDTTNDLLNRFDKETGALKPDAIIFSIGTNDSTHLIKENKNRVPIERFENNLYKIFELAKKYTTDLTYVGIMPVDESRTSPIPWATNIIYKNSSIKKYNDKIKEVCGKEDIKFIDLYNRLIKMDYKILLYDGLHPSAKGHEQITNEVISELNL